MCSALALPGDNQPEETLGTSVALGAVRRWPQQHVATIPGVRIALDADLVNLEELTNYVAGKGLPVQQGISLAAQLAWLYKTEGREFVNRLRGAFSIALWDEESHQLHLAIDRLGVKSLYWSFRAGRLLFATRAGAIQAAADRPASVNPSAVMQYLLFSVVPAPQSIYEGVEKVRPGHWLTNSNGQVRQQAYWDLQYEESPHSEQYWSKQVREQIRAAVHVNLEGCDSNATGAFLSGGTDSSSVVAFMSERFSPTRTFSISFGESRYNEIGYARTTAERFRSIHHERCLTPSDAMTAVSKIAQYYDEPFANSSAIGSYHCAQLARENGVDTLLAGDGGDELFAGNSRYATDKYFALYQSVPQWLRKGFIEPAARLLPENDGWLSLPRKYIRRAQIPNPRRIFSYGLFFGLDPGRVFESAFLEQAPPSEWMNIADMHFADANAQSELNRLMYLDLKLILADNDLRKVSGTAELSGVRVRYPFLDYRLAELSGHIPTKLKLKGFKKRYIFKQAMAGILPNEVLSKKKHGFGVPLGLWFLQDPQLEALVQDTLCDTRTRQRGYFRAEFFDQLMDMHRSGHTAFYGEVVWYLVALELWHRQHLDSNVRSVSA